jgi:hypothetical protein
MNLKNSWTIIGVSYHQVIGKSGMIQEHKRGILTVDLPEYQLKTGDVGTVVHVYTESRAYEMEFFTVDGQTLDVITVTAEQVRPVGKIEVLHARPLAS